MDSLTINKIKEVLAKYNAIAIAVPVDPMVDEMGAALALYLALKDMGKTVSIATPNTPLVEVSALVGIDQVRTTLGETSGDLVVSFPYHEGEIEKVSYTRDDNYLNIVVKAGEKGLNFAENDVKFSRGTKAPEVLFAVGAARISDLGKLYDPTVLKDTVVVNIDNKPDNQGYGDIVMVSNRFSSISEAVTNLLLTLGSQINLDIAENLMLGIATATNNFQDPRTSSLAFEMAGILMRNGALRPTSNQTRQEMPAELPQENPLPQNPFQPKKTFQSQPLPSFNQPKQNPQKVIERIQDQLKQTPIQSVESKEGTGAATETPPDDWLAPKIYKGSTNF
jgi:hypothetical protein